MAILFISGLQADHGQSDSGGNVLLGIADALCKYADDDVEFVSHPSVQSYPNGPLWIESNEEKLNENHVIKYLPTLNVKLVKSKLWGRQCHGIIREWSERHKMEQLKVLVYNTYHPPIDDVYKACKSVGAKLYAILYDLGIPPKRLKLGWLSMLGYRIGEHTAKKYIPLLDGRIIINELIAEHYAPEKDWILVDGGVNRHIIEHLFPLKEKSDSVFTFVLAGMLWDQNGTRLLIEAMRKYNNPNVRVVFAGKGIDVPLIQEAATKDKRIRYAGMLKMDELFKLYKEADVLLNLRLEEEVDFHFPGKLLEYLTTGRYVISTPVAHAERDYGQFMSVLHDKTPEGLVNLMDAVVQKGKPYLYHVGVMARQFMLEKRNWDVQTRRILEYMNSNI